MVAVVPGGQRRGERGNEIVTLRDVGAGARVGVVIVGRRIGVGGEQAAIVVVAVIVGRRIGQAGHDEHADEHHGAADRPRGQQHRSAGHRGRCSGDRDQRQRGGDRVGEPGAFGDLEAGDPGDPGQAGDDPPARRGGVDAHERQRGDAVGADETDDRCAGLGDRQQHEQTSQPDVVGVGARRSGVEHRGSGRGDRRDREPVCGRSVVIHRISVGVAPGRPGVGATAQNSGARFSRRAAMPSRYSAVRMATSRSSFDSATDAAESWRWRSR